MAGNKYLFTLVIWPFLAGLISYIGGRRDKKLRDYIVVASVLGEVVVYVLTILSVAEQGDYFVWKNFCGRGLYLGFDGFRQIYAGVAILMWLMTSIFSCEYFEKYRNRNRYYFFLLLTLGATMGVFLSTDLYTTFIFFEIMSLTSYTWVAHDEKEKSLKAAETYLAIAIIGGMVMLMGLFLLSNKLGTLRISELYSAAQTVFTSGNTADISMIYVAGGLILFGFGAKAGMFPLHIWLPKAHPVAPAPASALLPGILTKSGIFGVIVLSCEIFRNNSSWGLVILILGLITMFVGALLAIFSIDLKRTLACSSMSQIGFILTGISMICMLGEENALAARGTLLHMTNHSLFKLVLFMIAGAIYMKLHKLDLNEIRGYGRNKPILKFSFAIAGLGIAGLPLLSGYLSKTLIHEAIVEYQEIAGGLEGLAVCAEWIFLISGGMTLAYMLKLFIAIFVEKGNDKAFEEKKKYISIPSTIAIWVPAIIIIVCGVYPTLYVNNIADYGMTFFNGAELEYFAAFSLENLKGAGFSIAIGILLYFMIRKLFMKEVNGRKIYIDRWPGKLDLENLIYRPIIEKFIPFILIGFFRLVSETIPHLLFLAITKIGRGIAIALDNILDFRFDKIITGLQKRLKKSKKHPYLENLLNQYDRGETIIKVIMASISFGMLFVCLGLCFTLVYMLCLLFF